MFILTIPQIDLSKTPLNIPKATLKNCGGFRLPIADAKASALPSYSPIDLAVCGLSAIHNNEESVTNLSDWFIQNPYRIGEVYVYVTVGNKTNQNSIKYKTLNVSEWKHHIISNKKLESLFIKNAPFTFRR